MKFAFDKLIYPIEGPRRTFEMAELLFVSAVVFFIATLLFATNWETNQLPRLSFKAVKLDANQITATPTDLNRLSVAPVAVGLNAVFAPGDNVLVAFNLPSTIYASDLHISYLRADSSKFWRAGSAPEDSIFASKTGHGFILQSGLLALQAPATENATSVIGQFKITGLSRPEFAVTSAANSEPIEAHYNKSGGFISGGLIAVFGLSVILAALAKDKTFLFFSAWVLSTLRVVLINGGWDPEWMGISNSILNTDFFLRFTLALHPLLSLALFRAVFEDKLTKSMWRIATGLSSIYFIVLIFSANSTYVKVVQPVWITSVLGGLITIGLVLKLLPNDRTNTSKFYIFGWVTSLVGMIGEIAYSGGYLQPELRVIFNAQVSGITSILLTAWALAEKVKGEKIARQIAQRESVESLRKFKENYERMPVGLFSADMHGKITRSNPAFQSMFKDCVKSTNNWYSIFPDYNLSRIVNREGQTTECSMNEGTVTRWFEITGSLERDCFEGIVREISDRKDSETKLEFAAHHDFLTKLYNRNYLISSLEKLVTQGDVIQRQTVSLAMFDIEKFHQIVTYFGHETGDDVLQSYGKRIEERIPSQAIAGRLSADTFLIILPGMSVSATEILTASILNSINSHPFASRERSFSVKARAGVIELNASMDAKAALSAVDSATQFAKNKSDASYVRYDPESALWQTHKIEAALMAQFREKMPYDRLKMVYQPIVSLSKASETFGYEALLRLEDSAGQFISPAHFIPALEKNGMMSQIDRWVVREVFRFLESKPDHFEKLTYASVNLSGASLNDAHFLSEIIELAIEHPKTASKICFEITETVALADIKSTRKFVEQIKSLGAKVALDDFGAGHSSYGYITELGADFLKIDGALVKNINTSHANFAVVKSISDLGKSLGMKVVAEWVENADILTTLQAIGVNSGQGWILGKPLSGDQIAEGLHGAHFITDPKVKLALGLDLDDRRELSSHY